MNVIEEREETIRLLALLLAGTHVSNVSWREDLLARPNETFHTRASL